MRGGSERVAGKMEGDNERERKTQRDIQMLQALLLYVI